MPTAVIYDLAAARRAREGAPKTRPPVGQAVRDRRDAIGLSRQSLADRVGLSEAELSLYEAGAMTIPPRMLFLIAEALEVRLPSRLSPPA